MTQKSLLEDAEYVYVVMGLDDHACDRLVAICLDREQAEDICATEPVRCDDIFHFWIERHPVF